MDGIGSTKNPYDGFDIESLKSSSSGELQGISSQQEIEGGEASEVVFTAENGEIKKGLSTGEFTNDGLAKMNVNGEEVLANPTSMVGVGDEVDLGGNMRGEITSLSDTHASVEVEGTTIEVAHHLLKGTSAKCDCAFLDESGKMKPGLSAGKSADGAQNVYSPDGKKQEVPQESMIQKGDIVACRGLDGKMDTGEIEHIGMEKGKAIFDVKSGDTSGEVAGKNVFCKGQEVFVNQKDGPPLKGTIEGFNQETNSAKVNIDGQSVNVPVDSLKKSQSLKDHTVTFLHGAKEKGGAVSDAVKKFSDTPQGKALLDGISKGSGEVLKNSDSFLSATASLSATVTLATLFCLLCPFFLPAAAKIVETAAKDFNKEINRVVQENRATAKRPQEKDKDDMKNVYRQTKDDPAAAKKTDKAPEPAKKEEAAPAKPAEVKGAINDDDEIENTHIEGQPPPAAHAAQNTDAVALQKLGINPDAESLPPSGAAASV